MIYLRNRRVLAPPTGSRVQGVARTSHRNSGDDPRRRPTTVHRLSDQHYTLRQDEPGNRERQIKRGAATASLRFTRGSTYSARHVSAGRPCQPAANAARMARMWSGPVPQQPPTIEAPAATTAGACEALSSGV